MVDIILNFFSETNKAMVICEIYFSDLMFLQVKEGQPKLSETMCNVWPSPATVLETHCPAQF